MTDDPRDPMDSTEELTSAEMAALDDLLDTGGVWEDPPAELEDLIVAAITEEAAPLSDPLAPVAYRRERPRWLAVAAAVIIAFGVGALIPQLGNDDAEGPATTEFALSPTDLAGEASGTVELAELRNGLRIILAVESLPPAPEGQFYEAWMRTADDGVSAGTFHMRGETGEIELWAGVLSDGYPIFSITLEDEDGDTSSSGRVVMKADLTEPIGD